ncbi:transcriptional regulator NrdR [Candidatus Roizmanbacteria bacterium RIFCSPLOWO2_02_FULL_43_10]|uniref:Transcriptional repressor NrdR n=3 Tax=Candidatus Roizmaniibacteriota TaxID=1752723 RepID=A0A1F7JVX0_9BACT|nr:MAG: transcriptional regulator NrdR [Candidatus Roizmanbacteria bacterium RIFCSPHIGHO2_02_FULL_43_11]OGK37693.1 MAG: transcriptional regulator NrdR [Candidatus Roizmanbacteria bacterium RIFCSPHIGHO2_12_FULL_42_10]OGK59757.1 MAG: transcriptional regulator NrdR [Candidatus Roizmanbacteria bacterium RIFCSPLOWO2_02_FULL_43_10]
MQCIFCKNTNTEVVETRTSEDETVIRRRRECPDCSKRFTTYERAEQLPIIVIKRDGRRERFDRDKLRNSIIYPTEKTTVGLDKVEEIVQKIEGDIKNGETTEVESKIIGELVSKYLKEVDKVAYIRFSAVFKRFVDLEDFEKELKKLL